MGFLHEGLIRNNNCVSAGHLARSRALEGVDVGEAIMADNQTARSNAHGATAFECEFDDFAFIVIVIVIVFTGRQINDRLIGESGTSCVQVKVDRADISRPRFGLRHLRRGGKPAANLTGAG